MDLVQFDLNINWKGGLYFVTTHGFTCTSSLILGFLCGFCFPFGVERLQGRLRSITYGLIYNFNLEALLIHSLIKFHLFILFMHLICSFVGVHHSSNRFLIVPFQLQNNIPKYNKREGDIPWTTSTMLISPLTITFFRFITMLCGTNNILQNIVNPT